MCFLAYVLIQSKDKINYQLFFSYFPFKRSCTVEERGRGKKNTSNHKASPLRVFPSLRANKSSISQKQLHSQRERRREKKYTNNHKVSPLCVFPGPRQNTNRNKRIFHYSFLYCFQKELCSQRETKREANPSNHNGSHCVSFPVCNKTQIKTNKFYVICLCIIFVFKRS